MDLLHYIALLTQGCLQFEVRFRLNVGAWLVTPNEVFSKSNGTRLALREQSVRDFFWPRPLSSYCTCGINLLVVIVVLNTLHTHPLVYSFGLCPYVGMYRSWYPF
ncbi:unnamed protein product [Ectocarpus sp. 8 AP-2014]